MKILRVPHLDELLLMRFCPFPYELPAPLRDSALDDVEVLELHDSNMVTILDVDVPRRVLSVDEKHPNHDTVEPAYFGHD